MVKVDTIRDDGLYGLCAGTLVAPRAVLTAAHCLYDSNGRPRVTTVNAYIGDLSSNSTKKPLYGSFYISPGYSPSHSNDEYGDLALILLNSSSDATPVTLDDGTFFNISDWFIAAGWGRTEATGQPLANSLKWVAVPGVNDADYTTWIMNWSKETGYPPLDLEIDHFPSGLGNTGKDTCSGDSGGPLLLPGSNYPDSRVNEDIQVGIVSYGLSPTCGGSNNLGLYTKVGYWSKWIDDSLSMYNMRGKNAPTRVSGDPSVSACLNGGEFSKTSGVASAGGCCEICRQETACFAWSWGATSKVCSLKKKSGYSYKSGDCVSAQMKSA